MVFPGTMTDRRDELESNAALYKLEIGLWNESCFRIFSELVALGSGCESETLELWFSVAGLV